MIGRRIGPDATFFRYLTPKWAHLPLSGAGVAVHDPGGDLPRNQDSWRPA